MGPRHQRLSGQEVDPQRRPRLPDLRREFRCQLARRRNDEHATGLHPQRRRNALRVERLQLREALPERRRQLADQLPRGRTGSSIPTRTPAGATAPSSAASTTTPSAARAGPSPGMATQASGPTTWRPRPRSSRGSSPPSRPTTASTSPARTTTRTNSFWPAPRSRRSWTKFPTRRRTSASTARRSPSRPIGR